jgi:hypothetical protein
LTKKVLVLFLGVSICSLFGCASPNASREPDTYAVPAASPAAARSPKPTAPKREANLKPVKPKPSETVVTRKPEVASVAPAATDRKPVTKPAEMRAANAMERNQYLSSIVKPLVPPRTNITNAATGFKNQKDFIAALHASRNLGIPFSEIKSRMTAEHRMSLSESLRDIRPEMTKNLAKAEAHKAEQQAKDDEKLAKDKTKKAAAQEKLAANRK